MPLSITFIQKENLIIFVSEKENHEKIKQALSDAGVKLTGESESLHELSVDLSQFEAVDQLDNIVRNAGFYERTKEDDGLRYLNVCSYYYKDVVPVAREKEEDELDKIYNTTSHTEEIRKQLEAMRVSSKVLIEEVLNARPPPYHQPRM
ncbi:MAG: hypothetical protein A2103_04915 [Gammaproteobacteria bacterium GWF2_41_13]|nr:MAG: hypothetical protein A2103_04915 [Gammaproteobacteria bacterium GWF2_41_13]